jgi:hypothetical protein
MGTSNRMLCKLIQFITDLIAKLFMHISKRVQHESKTISLCSKKISITAPAMHQQLNQCSLFNGIKVQGLS